MDGKAKDFTEEIIQILTEGKRRRKVLTLCKTYSFLKKTNYLMDFSIEKLLGKLLNSKDY